MGPHARPLGEGRAASACGLCPGGRAARAAPGCRVRAGPVWASAAPSSPCQPPGPRWRPRLCPRLAPVAQLRSLSLSVSAPTEHTSDWGHTAGSYASWAAKMAVPNCFSGPQA